MDHRTLLGIILLTFPLPVWGWLAWPRIPHVRYKSPRDMALMWAGPVILWAGLVLVIIGTGRG